VNPDGRPDAPIRMLAVKLPSAGAPARSLPDEILRCLMDAGARIATALPVEPLDDAVIILFSETEPTELPDLSGAGAVVLVRLDGGTSGPAGTDAVVPLKDHADCGAAPAVIGLAGKLAARKRAGRALFEKIHSLAAANREAARLVLELEEKERRIREQARDIEEKARSLARANAEAGRLILEIEERDRRIGAQADEIRRYYDVLQQEMRLARRLQIGLLPEAPHPIPGLACHDRFIPASELCGDYYDYFRRSDGSFDIVIADVTGHGVASAMVSVQVRALAHIYTLEGLSPPQVLARINEFMCENFHKRYLMTMFIIHVAPDFSVAYAGAGHNPFYFTADGKNVQRCLSQGIPLGIQKNYEYRSDTLSLSPGARMLLYTDGLVEIQNAEDVQFGYDRLEDVFLKGCAQNARGFVDALLKEVEYFSETSPPFPDDVTIVLVERSS